MIPKEKQKGIQNLKILLFMSNFIRILIQQKYCIPNIQIKNSTKKNSNKPNYTNLRNASVDQYLNVQFDLIKNKPNSFHSLACSQSKYQNYLLIHGLNQKKVIEIHYFLKKIMNCTYHIKKEVQFICKASHKCKFQRKLCTECLYEHEVDIKQTVPIDKFVEQLIKKLKESKLDETSELNNQRMKFKSLVSQVQNMMKKMWEDLTISINQVYDIIEQENKSYINLINENTNLAEASYTDLEKLLQILEGNTLNYWNTQKDLYLINLEKAKNWLSSEVTAFNEKIQKELTPLINCKINHQIQTYQDHLQQLIQLQQGQEQQIKSVPQFKIKPFTYQIIKQNSIPQTQSCWAVAFNKDCSIVAATCDELIKIYEFKQGKLKQIQVLNDHQRRVCNLLFLKKSNQLISGDFNGSILIWSINNNNQWICSQTLKQHDDRIHCLIMNNYENIIVSSSEDKTIKFWIKQNGWALQQTNTSHKGSVYQLSLIGQKNKVISCGNDKLILILEYSEQNKRWAIVQNIQVDQYGLRLCFVNDNLFTFQPHKGNLIHVYELNIVSKQFTKTKQISLDQSDGDSILFFPQQYIKPKQLLVSKHSNINLIRKIENDEFKVEQSIEFGTNQLYGQMSDDGEYLITWDDKSKEIQIRRYIEK
ncbi:unnamed protein product [Paramecium sonneborni]|uniref:WD40-repeat-containing domain n=1 Tax=Paramecium sonneborni TaxID=65129 RepID=A0A8S1MC61_9CILI|nr:unnamed protein product [Paramecium sonneborni]